MVRRIIYGVLCLLAVGAVCAARQETSAAVPAQEASARIEPITTPEMDALATQLAEKLRTISAKSVVVVGGGNPENKVYDLGVSLRDGLNEALVKQAAGNGVISSADLRDAMRRNRASADLIYCNPASDWIAVYARAEVAVIVRLDRVENLRAAVTVELWDMRKKLPNERDWNTAAPVAKYDGQITLTEMQTNSATVEHHPWLIIHAPKDGSVGTGMPVCVDCPRPRILNESGQLFGVKFRGTVYLDATVRVDGTADDILIVRPVGIEFLNGAAINAVLKWKFKPAVDAQNRPVAARVPIEIAYQVN